MPATMRAVTLASYGGPEVLALREVPTPSPRDDEVLIRVAAAGVNRGDLVQREGRYPPPPGASEVLGLEVSGTVVARGAAVQAPCVGEAVCALLAGGGYAEYCTVPAAHCLPIPDGVSITDAAALPETYATVWDAVWDQARIAAGETLLVHGGTSGIGTCAIRLARAFGHDVYVTAGSPGKAQACAALGATRAIDYTAEDFVAAVREATGGRGVDVLVDMVAGDYVPRNVAALASEGRLVFIAFQRGADVAVNVRELMHRRLTLIGTTLRGRPAHYKARLIGHLRERVWPRFGERTLDPVVAARFPLAQAADAHRLMASGRHVGKILLVT